MPNTFIPVFSAKPCYWTSHTASRTFTWIQLLSFDKQPCRVCDFQGEQTNVSVSKSLNTWIQLELFKSRGILFIGSCRLAIVRIAVRPTAQFSIAASRLAREIPRLIDWPALPLRASFAPPRFGECWLLDSTSGGWIHRQKLFLERWRRVSCSGAIPNVFPLDPEFLHFL